MLDRKHEYIKMADVEDRHWWYKSLNELVLHTISKQKKDKSIKIVDAGCGTGGLLSKLKSEGFLNISGFDLSDTGVEIGRQKSLDVVQSDILNIHKLYTEDSVDVITSNDTFYFFSVEQRLEITNKFYNLLKRNGLVIVNLPALNAFSGIHDISVGCNYRFNKQDIFRIFDPNKYELLRSIYWPFMLSPVIFLSRLIQRIQLALNPDTGIESDIDLPSDSVNNLLYKIVAFENKWLRFKPFGSSLFLIMRKK